MGMFDSIIINVHDLPLSKADKQDLIDKNCSEDILCQTKDLDSVMEFYHIENAKLVYLGKFIREKYTGVIRFTARGRSNKLYAFLVLVYKDDVILIEEDS